ncbi:hypothetical protein LSAT2_030646 [Lamellibrachia satsuma]|nr:hypothetical protein LSAT2_030646 [Lamellibrachia satsuma]
MMLLILAMSATLLGTIQVSGETCSRVCTLDPWQPWGSCSDLKCSGYHTRKRSICCKTYHDLDECLQKCGYSSSTISQRTSCDCVRGYYSDRARGMCSCYSGSYGTCCQYQRTTTTTSAPEDSSSTKKVAAGVGSVFVCNNRYDRLLLLFLREWAQYSTRHQLIDCQQPTDRQRRTVDLNKTHPRTVLL